MDKEQLFDSVLDAIADRLATRICAAIPSGASESRLLDVGEAARYLNRSTHSVRHLAAIGKLPAVRFDDRVFFDRKDLDQAIEEAKTFDNGVR